MSTNALQLKRNRPVYLQISDLLENEIRAFYRIGDFLPSERELAERFEVNRHTVRRAVDELIASGLVDRQHGRGLAVVGLALDYPIRRDSRFTENIDSLGHSSVSRVVAKRIIPASSGVARRLGLAEHQEVICIDTLRSINQLPMGLNSHFLPRRFEAVFQDYNEGSLHAFLQKHYDRQLRRKYSLISSSLPQGDDARQLSMPAHMPVLRIKTLNVDALTGCPIEYSLARNRAEAIQLRIDFNGYGVCEHDAEG
jgi:GntR family phosphonate transport system transcriptional regulator